MDHVRGCERRAPVGCVHDDRHELGQRLISLHQFHGAPLLAQKRLTILKPKIERLPDDHQSKPECLFELSRLYGWVGNQAERKRLLTHALRLCRKRGSDHYVAQTLREISDANREMGLYKEGMELAREGSEISGRLGDTVEQAHCLILLAMLLRREKQFDAAEEVASRAIHLLPEKGEQYMVCYAHHVLGVIYQYKGETVKAIHHIEVALGIASSFDWQSELFWIHSGLADLFLGEGRPDDANTHAEQAKSHAADSPYSLGCAMKQQASVWCWEQRFEEARSEVMRAAEVFEKLGAAKEVKECREVLQNIQMQLDNQAISG